MRRFTVIVLGALLLWMPHTPSPASELDPALRSKIEKFMELTGAKQIGRQMGTGLVQQMIAGMKAADPDAASRGLDIVSEVVTGFLESRSDPLFEQLIPLYAKYYTEEDLDALNAFYSSPTGRKVIETMPSLLQESMQIGVEWAQELMPELQNKIYERLVSEGIIEADESSR